MTTTPTGSPAWTRTASAAIYGGDNGKRDLGGLGAVNAKTDVTAAQWLRMAGDLSCAVHSAPLFWMRITVSYSSTPVAASVTCGPMWGDVATYVGVSPPSTLYPNVAANSSSLRITFPGRTAAVDGVNWITIADEYGISGAFQMEDAQVSQNGGASIVAGTLSVDGTVLDLTNCTTNGMIVSVAVF
jgi:hypothetical protein